MRATGMIALAACVLSLSGAAHAELAEISHTLDYTTNGQTGYFFWPPTEEYIDHPPYYRGSLEDWDWTHVVTPDVPQTATDIDVATVSILAWDVDSSDGEDDIIYVNGTKLGMLTGSLGAWTVTSFELPTTVLDELWRDGEASFFMDIDQRPDGHRVTLKSSTLAVTYQTSGTVPEPATVGLLGLGSLLMVMRRRSQGRHSR
jgi:hypothetical protein